MENSPRRSSKPATVPTPIPKEIERVRHLFVKRVTETIFSDYFGRRIYSDFLYGSLTSWVAHAVGSRWEESKNLSFYVEGDFDRCQKALEACAEILSRMHNKEYSRQFDQLLLDLIQECCGELGIRWERGRFSRTS